MRKKVFTFFIYKCDVFLTITSVIRTHQIYNELSTTSNTYCRCQLAKPTLPWIFLFDVSCNKVKNKYKPHCQILIRTDKMDTPITHINYTPMICICLV